MLEIYRECTNITLSMQINTIILFIISYLNNKQTFDYRFLNLIAHRQNDSKMTANK